MDVKDFMLKLPTPRTLCQSIPTLSTNRIIPKHKKSISSLHGLTSFIPLSENKILTALTPRRLLEAQYKQKESFDQQFSKNIEKKFKENLEIQEKRKKFEERKRKEEEFLALKEAKNRMKQEEMQRDKDDFKRGQELLKRNQLSLEENKLKEIQFLKDKRSLNLEYFNVRKKIQWEGKRRERELSLDSLRPKLF